MHGNTKCKEKIRALFSTGGLKTTLYYQLIPFSMTTPFKSSRLAVVSVLVPCVVSMAQREHEDLKDKNARESGFRDVLMDHTRTRERPSHARVSSPQGSLTSLVCLAPALEIQTRAWRLPRKKSKEKRKINKTHDYCTA